MKNDKVCLNFFCHQFVDVFSKISYKISLNEKITYCGFWDKKRRYFLIQAVDIISFSSLNAGAELL